MASHPRTQVRTAGPSASTAPATSGSQTILQTEPQAGPSNTSHNATLRLRGASPQRESSQRVQWAEDVIDNEGLGKKSSKVCCIYHKPHQPGDESSGSDSSSSSSDGESDEEADLSRAQRAGGGKGKRGRKDGREGKGNGNGKGERKPSPNAYERVPKHRHHHKGKKEG